MFTKNRAYVITAPLNEHLLPIKISTMACLATTTETTAGHSTTQAKGALIDSMYFVAWNTPTTEGTVVTNQYL